MPKANRYWQSLQAKGKIEVTPRREEMADGGLLCHAELTGSRSLCCNRLSLSILRVHRYHADLRRVRTCLALSLRRSAWTCFVKESH